MRRTTVYLTEADVESLRLVAAATGRSQAELIRESIRLLVEKGAPRTFYSMAKGESSGETHPCWRSDELYEKALGRS